MNALAYARATDAVGTTRLGVAVDARNMGAHGVGEIDSTSVGAAVANAVYNATGIRVLDLPITLDKMM